ncbi:MAG: aldo/keto reductase [Phycisphaerae bacterium]|nr:aldo/keto reductase [Phycisphaerae bacterium]
MIYRKLGKSDVEISAITFGAWAVGGWMWGGTDEAQSIAAIRKAIELGITSIDTAAVYGFGRSEEIVAKAIEPCKREDLQILTKFGLRWDISEPAPERWKTTGRDGKPATVSHWAKADGIIHECEQSLKRLNTDYIDVFQQHWPDPGTPVDESAEALTKLLAQGKIRAVGESNFSVELLDEISHQIPIASNQPPYSMVNRGIEDDVLPYCVENDISVIVYSPLQRGLLTGKITPGYEFHGDDHRANSGLFKGENLNRTNAFLNEIRPIAESHGATLAQLVINWTLNRPGITAVLVGARNPKQAEENAKALQFDLSEDETASINEKLDALELTS